MIIPFVCYSCGQCIAHVYQKYLDLITKVSEAEAMEKLNVTRLCCRRMIFCHHDTARIMNYNAPANYTGYEKISDQFIEYSKRYNTAYEQNKDPVRKYNNAMKELIIKRAITLAKIKGGLRVIDIAGGLAPDTTRFNDTGIFKNYIDIDYAVDNNSIDTILDRYSSIIEKMDTFEVIKSDINSEMISGSLENGNLLFKNSENPRPTKFNMISCFFGLHYFINENTGDILKDIYSLLDTNNAVFIGAIINFESVRFNQESHSLYSITDVETGNIKINNQIVAIKKYRFSYPHLNVLNSYEIAVEPTSFAKALSNSFPGYTVEIVPFDQMTKKARALWNSVKPEYSLDAANKQLFDLYSTMIVYRR